MIIAAKVRQVPGRSTVIPIGSTPIAGALFGSGCEYTQVVGKRKITILTCSAYGLEDPI